MSIPDFEKILKKNKESWTELPLHTVIYEWLLRNMKIPTDFSTILAYLAIFLITWYTIIWVVRILMSILWPLFIVLTAVFVFRYLQTYNPQELTEIASKSLSIVADNLVKAFSILLLPYQLPTGIFYSLFTKK